MSRTDYAPIFNIVAWGYYHVDLMLELALPSLLTPNNLPLFADSGAEFRIYTQVDDEEKIKSHPTYRRLKEIMPVSVIFDSKINPTEHYKYHLMTGFHLHVLGEAYQQDRPLVFLSPDTCWSEDALLMVKKALDEGKRALMISAPRIEYESFCGHVNRLFPMNKEGVRTARSRDLVKASFDHQHAYTHSLYWDSPDFNKSIAYYYFNVPNDSVLCRYFVLHPLMAWPKRSVSQMTYTIDIDLIPMTMDDYDELMIVRDSDDLFAIEISPREDPDPNKYIKKDGSLVLWSKHQQPDFPEDADMKAIAATIHCKHNFDNPFHKQFMYENIRYHTGDTTPYHWQEAEARAEKITDMITNWWEKDSHALFQSYCDPSLEGEILAGAGPRW